MPPLVDLDQLPFGATLQYFRRAALQTQEDLARAVGYPPTLVSMIERGQRFPRRETAEEFAAALGLLPEECEALLAAHTRTAAQRAAHKVSHGQATTSAARDTMSLGPLVARESEMAQVLALLRGPRAGGWVILSGEPGIGKTRLALEAVTQAHAQGMGVAVGHCYREQQSAAYSPFVEILEQMTRAISGSLRQQISQQWPLVSRLLPGMVAREAPSTGGAPLDQQVFFWQVADFLRAIVEERPHVVLLDDLHWADESSLDLLLALGRFQRNLAAPRSIQSKMPLWLIGTYRETEAASRPVLRRVLHALEKERLAERVALAPLTAQQTTDLLNAYLHSGAVAADVSDRIYRIAGGVPFAVVGLLRGMRARGDLALDGETWRQTGSGEIELPVDILEEIREDVGRLRPLTQDILRDASVLGEVFAATTAQRIGERTPSEVENALAEAEAAGLIRGAAREGYRFEHALVQRALYTAISTPVRRRLHRAAALALVEAPARRGRSAELAWHFRKGDDLPQAIHYSLEAGDDAEATYAHKDAQQHYLMAVGLARDLGDQAHEALALERLADAHYLLGLFNDAFGNLERATVIYRSLQDWERLAWATAQMAKVCDVLGRVPESMQFVEALLDTLITVAESQSQHPDDERVYPQALADRAERAVSILSERTAARVLLCLVARLVYLGRFDEVPALSLTVGRYARRAKVLRMESLNDAFRGMAQSRLGQMDDAAVSLRAALRIAEACGDLEATFLALANLGAIHQQRAELHQARQLLLRTHETLGQMDDTLRASTSLYRLGVNAFLEGDWAEARARYEEALTLGARSDRTDTHRAWLGLMQLDIAEGKRPLTAELAREEAERVYQREDMTYQLYASGSLAGMAIVAGFAEELREFLKRLVASLSERDPSSCEQLALLAWANLEVGNLAAAHETLAAAERRAEALGVRLAYTTIWRIAARLALSEGRWDEGLRALEQAVTLAQAMPYPYAEAQARYVAGLLHRARGEPGDAGAARQAFTDALALLTRLGERFYAERVERELAELSA